MKILPNLINVKNSVYGNIRSTYSKVSSIQKNGNEIAQRASSIYKKEDKLGEYKYAAKMKQTLKAITPYNVPIIGGVLGFISPIPGASVVLFVAGGFVGLGMILHEKLKLHNNNKE